MGKELQIPMQILITASSRDAALEQIAMNKAREVSFKTFLDRLQLLRDKFKLPVIISTTDIEKLLYFTTLRNSAVHDQGILELKVGKSGGIINRLKSSPNHPTKITSSDADDAGTLYLKIVERVSFDVLTHILKVKKSGLPPNLKKFTESAKKTKTVGKPS